MSGIITNKYIKAITCILSTFLFIIAVVPIASILFEIIFKFGNIIGTFIRSYGC